MLRIDETSKTLVAPQAGGLVTEGHPDRDELLALLVVSWDAFSAELGHPSLRFVAAEPVPGLDILAFDEHAGRAVVVQVTGAVEFGRGRPRRWPPPPRWRAGTPARCPPSTSRCRPPCRTTRRRSS